MSALGARRATRSGSRIRSFVVAVLGLALLHPAASEANTRPASTTQPPVGKDATAVATQQPKHHGKAKRHARPGKAKQKQSATKVTTAKKHTKHTGKGKKAQSARTTVKQPGATRLAASRPHTKHGRKAKRRNPDRVATRRHDPAKLIIPQGDGSPVLSVAAHYLGRPYHFGSEGRAFDCSGLVRTVFAEMGVDLPHSARELATLGDRVRRDELEPGDLVFFRNARRLYATHVGIYVGEDKFVHAATRSGQVQVDSLKDTYYARHYLGARRLDI